MKLKVRRRTFPEQLRGFPPPTVVTLTLPFFIALKLAHVTDWSWWWVLSPLWIPILLGLVVLALGAAAYTLLRWFLMGRAWLRMRRTMVPEFVLADAVIRSRIEAARPLSPDAGLSADVGAGLHDRDA